MKAISLNFTTTAFALSLVLQFAISTQAQQRGTFDRTYKVALDASPEECREAVSRTLSQFDVPDYASLTVSDEGSTITAYVNEKAEKRILELSCIHGLN